MAGRPSTFTPEKREKILSALRAGNYRCAAARYAGVEVACFTEWIYRGNKGDEPYAEFAKECKRAEGEAEAALVATVRKASVDTWTAAAWILERKYSQRWGRRDPSWERDRREARQAQAAQLAEVPLEELERMVAAERARRGKAGA
jgi:hypothetical protein